MIRSTKYTTRTAAEYLGVSQRWVKQLCQRGDLGKKNVHGHYEISHSQLVRYVPRPTGRPRKK